MTGKYRIQGGENYKKKLVKEEVLFFCIAPACFYDKINYLTLKRKRLVLKLSKVYSRNILFGAISRWMMKLAGNAVFYVLIRAPA